MRVVFLHDVQNVAEAGDVREVKRGYAKNYLFPRELAVPATAGEMNRIEALKRTAEQRRQRVQEESGTLGQRLEGVSLTLLQRAGPMGRLYGSVTNADIAEELSKAVGQPVDRRAVEIGEPIRQTGEFEVTVRVGPNQAHRIKVVVTTEELLQQQAMTRERRAREAEALAAAEEQEALTVEEVALTDEVQEAVEEDSGAQELAGMQEEVAVSDELLEEMEEEMDKESRG